MSPHDIPPLIPKPPEKDWADYNTNPDLDRTGKRRRASLPSARDVLALPPVTLAPGATLADSELVMPDAAAVVFIPNTLDRGLITYSDALADLGFYKSGCSKNGNLVHPPKTPPRKALFRN